MSHYRYEFAEADQLTVWIDVSKFDALVCPEFERFLEGIWAENLTEVQIDLSAVGFIDSSGIGALLAAHKRAGEGQSVVLTGVNEPVQEIITLLRLQRVFTLRSDPA